MHMRAAKIYGPGDVRIVDEDMPVPQQNEILVQILYAGICGSDIHYFFDGASGVFNLREPLTPGHEVAGVVAIDPTGRYAVGTPVTINPARFGSPVLELADRPHLWPGGSYLGSASTTPHTQGGMAEYRVFEADMVRALPPTMSARTGALAEPLAVALHALSIFGSVRDQKILVVGCGPIGLCVIGACVVKGAASVECVDLYETAVQRGSALGATQGYNVRDSAVPSAEYDVVFECSGTGSAIGTAFEAVRRAGVIVQVGNLPAHAIEAAIGGIVSKEISYRGSFRINGEFDEALDMLLRYPVFANVVTHEVALEAIAEGFEIARDSARSGKVLVSLDNSATYD